MGAAWLAWVGEICAWFLAWINHGFPASGVSSSLSGVRASYLLPQEALSSSQRERGAGGVGGMLSAAGSRRGGGHRHRKAKAPGDRAFLVKLLSALHISFPQNAFFIPVYFLPLD